MDGMGLKIYEYVKGFHEVKDLYRYAVYQSSYNQGAWTGRLETKKGKVVYILGMEQDDLCVSWDKDKTEKGTKALFDYYTSKG
jgi:hypothetical protein